MEAVVKFDNEQQIVYGWASVAKANGEAVIDSQDDVIDIYDLEAAANDFVLDYREANDMHAGPATGRLVQSLVTTPETIEALGLPEDMTQGWWVGFKIDDPQQWATIKEGSRMMFSIEGERMPLDG